MHYHLSAPHGPGPSFWNHLIARHVRIGHALSRVSISEVIGSFLKESEMKTLGNRTLQSAATVFLGTYAKSDGLGKLGLIEEESGSYTVRQPQTPPVRVLACALHDYWEAFGDGSSEPPPERPGLSGRFCRIVFSGTGHAWHSVVRFAVGQALWT